MTEPERRALRRARQVAVVAVLGVALALAPGTAQEKQHERRWPTDILRETFGYGGDTPTDVAWSDLAQGCPRRDCIPAIDQPRFVAAAEAKHVLDADLVLGIEIGGIARAYPAAILDTHEIVNDRFGELPVAVTWCPLCGSGLAFRRELDGKAVELGVSGLLHESDLVFYDRETESLWQQITGAAFAGPRRGERLAMLPVTVATWKQWRDAHPASEVLVGERGAGAEARQPGPYAPYIASERLMFPVARESRRLHPKRVVYGFELDGGALAATAEALAQGPRRARVGEVDYEVERRPDGSVVARAGDGEPLVAHRMFWFAWYTFHPETALLTEEETK